MARITGGTGSDFIRGSGGNDTLTGGWGGDTFSISDGSATITDLGKGGDTLNVGLYGRALAFLADTWVASVHSSNDGFAQLIANGHNVDVSLAQGTQGWKISNNGNSSAVTFTGSAHNDTLIGGTGGDALDGGAGDDTLAGGEGSDRFSCNDGNDTITDLGKGGDVLTVGQWGRVTATLAADWNADMWSNNNGQVTIIANGHNVNLSGLGDSTQGWTITNGSNATAVNIVGSSLADTLSGGNRDDTLDGGGGSDTYVVDRFRGYDSFVDSGISGADTIVLGAAPSAGVTLGLKLIEGIEIIDGRSGLKNWISGSNGDDTWDFSGVTFLGKICINVGGGNNWVLGTNGNDYIQSASATTGGNDTLKGGAGDDTLFGGAGLNELIGGDGDDALWGHGAHGETLDGGAGNDKLVAGGNGDILIGGLGNDWLHGGTGDDTFVFGSNRWGNDVVVNFDHGHDALDFRGSGIQYSDLQQSLSPSGLHTVIGYHGSWLTFANVTNVTAADFIFA